MTDINCYDRHREPCDKHPSDWQYFENHKYHCVGCDRDKAKELLKAALKIGSTDQYRIVGKDKHGHPLNEDGKTRQDIRDFLSA